MQTFEECLALVGKPQLASWLPRTFSICSAELKEKEGIQQGDICVRPTDRLAVLQPDRPFYSVGSIVKVSIC